MRNHFTSLLSFALIAAVAGCGGDSGSRPPAGANAATLLPIRIPESRKDKGLIAAAAGPEEAAAPAQPAARETVEEIAIDNSSPTAAVESLLRVVRAGSADRLADVLIEEQVEPVGRILEAARPVVEAATNLKAALDERFANHAIVLSMPDSPLVLLSAVLGTGELEVDEIDDEHSEAVLQVPNPSGDPSEVRLEVRKIDESWRIRLPDFQAPQDVEALGERWQPVARALEAVTEKVRNNDLADEPAARAAVEAAWKGEAPPAGDDSGSAEPQAAGSPTPAAADPGSGGGDRRGDIKVTPTAIPVVIDSGGL